MGTETMGERTQLSSCLFFFLNLYWICYNIASFVYVLSFRSQGMWGLSSPIQGATPTHP